MAGGEGTLDRHNVGNRLTPLVAGYMLLIRDTCGLYLGDILCGFVVVIIIKDQSHVINFYFL